MRSISTLHIYLFKKIQIRFDSQKIQLYRNNCIYLHSREPRSNLALHDVHTNVLDPSLLNPQLLSHFGHCDILEHLPPLRRRLLLFLRFFRRCDRLLVRLLRRRERLLERLLAIIYYLT
jgi:hypothetical protein